MPFPSHSHSFAFFKYLAWRINYKAFHFTPVTSMFLGPGNILSLSTIKWKTKIHTHSKEEEKYKYIFFVSLQPFVGTWSLFSFLILYTGGRNPLTSGQTVPRPLPKHRATQTQNKRIHTHQISMPWVGSEPTITMSERAKTVHALDCAANVTGKNINMFTKYLKLTLHVSAAYL
jgi:hypothetical protein